MLSTKPRQKRHSSMYQTEASPNSNVASPGNLIEENLWFHPNLLNQNLHFNQIPRWFKDVLKFKKLSVLLLDDLVNRSCYEEQVSSPITEQGRRNSSISTVSSFEGKNFIQFTLPQHLAQGIENFQCSLLAETWGAGACSVSALSLPSCVVLASYLNSLGSSFLFGIWRWLPCKNEDKISGNSC